MPGDRLWALSVGSDHMISLPSIKGITLRHKGLKNGTPIVSPIKQRTILVITCPFKLQINRGVQVNHRATFSQIVSIPFI
jgi:hypothetical protein